MKRRSALDLLGAGLPPATKIASTGLSDTGAAAPGPLDWTKRPVNWAGMSLAQAR